MSLRQREWLKKGINIQTSVPVVKWSSLTSDQRHESSTYIVIKRVSELAVIVKDEESPLPSLGLVELEVRRSDEQVAIFAYFAIGLEEEKETNRGH